MTTKKQTKISKELKDDIIGLLNYKAEGVVKDCIVPPLRELFATWSGELIGKLSTLNAEKDKEVEFAFNKFYDRLVKETIKQLRLSQKIKE